MFFQVGIQLLLVKNYVGAGFIGISVRNPTPLENPPVLVGSIQKEESAITDFEWNNWGAIAFFR